jgi:hypothetical protein
LPARINGAPNQGGGSAAFVYPPGRISLIRHLPSTATRTSRSWRPVPAGPAPTMEPAASFSSYAEELERTCTTARAAVAPSSVRRSPRVLEYPARTCPELRSRSAVRASAAAAGEPSAFTSSSSPRSPVLKARSRREASPWTAWLGSVALACCLATAVRLSPPALPPSAPLPATACAGSVAGAPAAPLPIPRSRSDSCAMTDPGVMPDDGGVPGTAGSPAAPAIHHAMTVPTKAAEARTPRIRGTRSCNGGRCRALPDRAVRDWGVTG